MPIAILIVLIVYIVIHTVYVIHSHTVIQYGEYKFNRKIERHKNLRLGSYNVEEFNKLNRAERKKYLIERKLK